MTRAIVILVAALALIGTAAASSSRSEIVTVHGPGFTTYVTHALPDGEIAVAAYANGVELKYGIVSGRTLEFTGRGLLVRFTVAKGAGPGLVRIASMRQATVRLRFVMDWSK